MAKVPESIIEVKLEPETMKEIRVLRQKLETYEQNTERLERLGEMMAAGIQAVAIALEGIADLTEGVSALGEGLRNQRDLVKQHGREFVARAHKVHDEVTRVIPNGTRR